MASQYFYLSENCSGRGVRLPTDPAAGLPFSFYCICNPGFSGEADYFDLRVNIPNVTSLGVPTSLDCTVSDVAAKVLWGILLGSAAVRLLLTLVALNRKHHDFKILTTRVKAHGRVSRLGYLPFQVLGIDAFGMVWLIYMTSAKISNLSDSVLGTNGIVTFAHVIAFASISLAWSLYEARTTFVLLNLKSLRDILSNGIARWQLGTTVIAMMSYFIVAIVSLVAVALPKANGPVDSGEIWIVVTRSIAMTGLGFAGHLAFSNVVKGVREISEQLRTVASSEHSPNGARITTLMAFLEETFKKMRLKLVVLLIIFWTMLIPYVFAYQYIVLSIALIFNNTAVLLALDFLRKRDVVEDEPHSEMLTSQKSSKKFMQDTLQSSIS